MIREAPSIDGAEQRQNVAQILAQVTNQTTPERTVADMTYLPKLQVFGCGGCGVNQVRYNEALLSQPHIKVQLFDTNKGNTNRSPFPINYLGTEGRGKNRGAKIEETKPKLDPILAQIDTPDVVLIFSSLSGGSGSVIGAFIAHHYLSTNIPVVIFGIADDNSAADCDNTLKSLETYAAIAEDSYLNLVLFDNSRTKDRMDVDRAVTDKLLKLLNMVNIKEIPDMDVTNIRSVFYPKYHPLTADVCGVYRLIIETEAQQAAAFDDTPAVTQTHVSFINNEVGYDTGNGLAVVSFIGKTANPECWGRILVGAPLPEDFVERFKQQYKKKIAAATAATSQVSWSTNSKSAKTHGKIVI
jgi:hypothetical protein